MPRIRGAKVEDGVDARELVEERHQKREQDGRFQVPRQCRPAGRLFFLQGGAFDFVGERGDLLGREIGVDLGEDCFALVAAFLETDQPPGTFWNSDGEQSVGDRRNGFHAQHPPPVVFAGSLQEGVGNEGQQNAEHDVELEQPGQQAAFVCGGDFGDVQRGGHRRDANAQAANESGDHEGINIRRQPGPHRGNEVENADPQQRAAASKPVGRNIPRECPHHRAHQCRRHRPTVQAVAQIPKSLDFLIRTGDDDRVESEYQSAQRSNNGAGQQFLRRAHVRCPG